MKRVSAMALSVALIFTLTMIVPTDNLLAETTLTVTVGSGSGAAGDTISIPVAITGNTGINAIEGTVTYDDSALEWDGSGYTFGTVLGSDSSKLFNTATNKFAFSSSEKSTANGVLITLNFKIKATATGGAKSVSIEGFDPSDENGLSVEFNPVVSGTITVVVDAPPSISPPSSAPSSSAPSSSAPSSSAPSSSAPSSSAPSSSAPSSSAPSSSAPSSSAPSSSAPSSSAPSSSAPSSSAPSSSAPSSSAPSSSAPLPSTSTAPSMEFTPVITLPVPTALPSISSISEAPKPDSSADNAPKPDNAPAPYNGGDNVPAPDNSVNNAPKPDTGVNNTPAQLTPPGSGSAPYTYPKLPTLDDVPSPEYAKANGRTVVSNGKTYLVIEPNDWLVLIFDKGGAQLGYVVLEAGQTPDDIDIAAELIPLAPSKPNPKTGGPDAPFIPAATLIIICGAAAAIWYIKRKKSN